MTDESSNRKMREFSKMMSNCAKKCVGANCVESCKRIGTIMKRLPVGAVGGAVGGVASSVAGSIMYDKVIKTKDEEPKIQVSVINNINNNVLVPCDPYQIEFDQCEVKESEQQFTSDTDWSALDISDSVDSYVHTEEVDELKMVKMNRLHRMGSYTKFGTFNGDENVQFNVFGKYEFDNEKQDRILSGLCVIPREIPGYPGWFQTHYGHKEYNGPAAYISVSQNSCCGLYEWVNFDSDECDSFTNGFLMRHDAIPLLKANTLYSMWNIGCWIRNRNKFKWTLFRRASTLTGVSFGILWMLSMVTPDDDSDTISVRMLGENVQKVTEFYRRK